jgi:hypothetical protein
MFGRDVECEIVDVQSQPNGNDCGLFAIAFMVTFALGKDPARFFFDTSALRSHFVKCLLRSEMQMFPVLKARVPGASTTEVVNVSRVRQVRKPARFVDEIL